MKLSEIHINPSNPRLIKDDRFKKLVKSIEEFPKMMELRPIIVDADGMILGGNMRFKALQELGYKEVPDEWIKRADELTEAEKQRFIIEDNVPFGEWNWETLANEWDVEQLADWGLDIPDFALNKEVTEDDYEIPDEIKTDIVLGDLFEIGQHRLLCGDSTDSDQVAKLMNGQKANLFLTDPPYNINFKAQRSGEGYSNHNDGMSKGEYMDLLKSVSSNGLLFSDKAIVTTGKQNLSDWIKNFDITDIGIWIAKNKMSGGRISHLSLWEPIVFIGKFNRASRPNDLFEYNTKFQEEANDHPCPKVIEFFAELIKCYCDDLVIDLFIGSGTTMVAAHQLNRKCYGMEIDPKYCQVIVDRMRKLDPAIVIKKNGEVI